VRWHLSVQTESWSSTQVRSAWLYLLRATCSAEWKEDYYLLPSKRVDLCGCHWFLSGRWFIEKLAMISQKLFW
jgi:hypothetical protein